MQSRINWVSNEWEGIVRSLCCTYDCATVLYSLGKGSHQKKKNLRNFGHCPKRGGVSTAAKLFIDEKYGLGGSINTKC